MKKVGWIIILCIGISSNSYASTIYSPGSGNGVFITTSTAYIQNTLSPNTTTQSFSVHQGSFSIAGFIMTDSVGCQWNATINTSGALVTTAIPSAMCGNSNTGQIMGILSSITYP